MDSNKYTVTYQNYSSENCPTLDLHATSNTDCHENEEGLGVVFVSPTLSYRHLSANSATSSDTQSSSNNLVMSQQVGESSPLKETHSDPFSVPSWIRHFGGLKLMITTMVVFSISITIALIVQIYVGLPQVIPHGGIVSSSSYCSKLGLDLLKSEKASSIDAAVLTALCLCVTQSHAAGVGGGGFALVHNQKVVQNATKVYNFREASPRIFSNQSFRSSSFEGKTINEISQVLSFAVPGVLKGLKELHDVHGKLSWAQIVNQAANIAQAGVTVSDNLGEAIKHANVSLWNEELRNLFLNQNGSKKAKGDLIQQPELAKLLKLIASQGANSFYSGNFAKNFTNQIVANGGVLTEADMKSYTTEVNHDVNETRYSDMKVVTPGPPSSGFALYSVMKTMSEYKTPDQTDTARFLQIHRLIEAVKFSLGFMTNLGDPLSPNYTEPSFYTNQSLGKNIKDKIDNSASFDPEHYLHGFEPLRLIDSNQQYVALIGPDAFAVVITLSVGSSFGSGAMLSGVLMNDAMKDFSWTGRYNSSFNLPPSKANHLQGDVRPMSPMIPMLVIPSVSKCGLYILPVVSATNLSLSDDTGVDLVTFLRDRNHSISLVSDNSLRSLSAVQWLDNIVHAYADERDSSLHDTALVF